MLCPRHGTYRQLPTEVKEEGLSEISLFSLPTAAPGSMEQDLEPLSAEPTTTPVLRDVRTWLCMAGEQKNKYKYFPVWQGPDRFLLYVHIGLYFFLPWENNMSWRLGQGKRKRTNKQTVTWLEIPLASMLLSPDKARYELLLAKGCRVHVVLRTGR